jgi:hypothetical protein
MKIQKENLKNIYLEEIKEIFDASLSIIEDIEEVNTKNSILICLCSTGFREGIREYFEIVAPDEKVKESINYKNRIKKDNEEERVTRKDRLIYAIYENLEKEKTDKVLKVDNSSRIKKINEFLGKELNKLTHINEKTIKSFNNKDDYENKINGIIKKSVEIVNMIDDLKIELEENLYIYVRNEIENYIEKNYIEILGSYATQLGDIEICDVEINLNKEESKQKFYYDIETTLNQELFYGSNSDRRKGDGLEINCSFIAKIESIVIIEENIEQKEIKILKVKIDDREFYGE